MSGIKLSRDDIALKIFGRKFTQLSTESKAYVNKTYGVMLNATRTGLDSTEPLRQAAFKETVSIVNQLKQIAANPGDMIELPKGVLQDAARVIHYQSQALGRGRILDAKDMDEIRKAVKKQFRTANPEVVECVADYLTNSKGSFSGVGVRTLRRKLRSFLTAEQLENLPNKEILAARDITIAHLFDKWSGGNLSSFVGPKLEDLLEQDVKRLKKSKPSISTGISTQEIQTTIDALETLEKYQNSSSRSLSNPIIKKALSNLGLTPGQIVSPVTKQSMGEITSEVHKFTSSRVKGHPKLGGGIRTRRNWKLHSKASSEYLGSLPRSYPVTGIGKPTSVSSRPYSGRYSSGWKWDIPERWESSGDTGYSSSKIYDQISSEMADFSNSLAEQEYGSNAVYKKKGNSAGLRIDAGPSRMTEHYTNLITKYAGSVTSAEASMGLSKQERQIHKEDISRYQENLKEYTSQFGNYYGRMFFEAGVPMDTASKVMGLSSKNNYRAQVAGQVVDWYSSGTHRQDIPITVNPDEFKPFSPKETMAGLYGELTPRSGVMKSVSKFLSQFPGTDTPAHLPDEVQHVISNIAHGKETVEGIKRVGIVGSKSFNNKSFLNKWMRKNWSDANLMITSAEVGKSHGPQPENTGAAFHASNWAHWSDTMQYKFPTRSTLKYNKDMTTADVINASDEVVAFFDRVTGSASDIAQLNKIKEAIGDKPLRIVWTPTDMSKSDVKDPKSFGMLMMEKFGNSKNVIFDKYNAGTIPSSYLGTKLKFLAKGGALKTNEPAIVGEAGPEALIPDGHGGFNVIPNSSLRFLAEGTFTPRQNVIVATGDKTQADPHFYRTAEGKVLPSVSTVLSNYSDEAAAKSASMKNIPEWVSQVGNFAHAMAESWAALQVGMDPSRFPLPDLSKYTTRTQTLESLTEKGETAGRALIYGLEQMGFVAAGIEERFVDLEKGVSGTIDLLGSVSGTPTVLDLKAQGVTTFGKEDPRYMMQVGAYASMFAEVPDMLKVLTGNRETGEVAEFTYVGDEIKHAMERWELALEMFNDRLAKGLVNIPQLIARAPESGVSPIASDIRLNEMRNTRVMIRQPRGGTEPYERVGITTTTPGHAQALSKIFPPFTIKGQKNPDWDKHVDRLEVFGKRLDELYTSAGNAPESVNPRVREVLDMFERGGIGHNEMSYLLTAPKGSVADNPSLIKAMRGIYDEFKPVAFAQERLEGPSEEKLFWEDARTILNVFEEAGKAFESVPDFTQPLPETSVPTKKARRTRKGISYTSVPGTAEPVNIPSKTNPPPSGGQLPIGSSSTALVKPPGYRSKCKCIDLCPSTMNAFRAMFRGLKINSNTSESTGGGRSRREKPPGTPLEEYNPGSRWRQVLEKIPIVGQPMAARRHWAESSAQAQDYLVNPPKGATVEEYTKLLQKEDIARGKYYRSIRGATTSFLIAQHVMRVFGQTSKVWNKSSEAVGKGLGYVFDMFLMPLLPVLRPLVGTLVGFGNILRHASSWPIIVTTIGLGALLLGKRLLNFATRINKIPEIIDKVNAALDKWHAMMDRTSESVNKSKPSESGEEEPDNVPVPVTGPEPKSETYKRYRAPKLPGGAGGLPGGTARAYTEGEPIEDNYSRYKKEQSAYFYSKMYSVLSEKFAESEKGPDGFPVSWNSAQKSYYKKLETKVSKYSHGIPKVPGSGNGDTVLAMLTPGEMVLPVDTAKKIRGYADGGIIGGAISAISGGMGAFATSDIGSAALTGLAGFGAISRTISSVMAPLAPIAAAGVIAGKGYTMVKNAITRDTAVTTQVSESGFTALRTMGGSQLIPLLSIAATALGIYNLIKGNQPVFPTGKESKTLGGEKVADTWNKVKDAGENALEELKKKATDFWDSLPKRFTDFIDGLKDKFGRIWDDWIKPGKDFVTELLDRIIKPGKDFVEDIKSRLGIKSEKVFGPEPKSVLDTVKEGGSNLLDKLGKGGYALTGGLVGANELFKGETDPIKIATAIIPALAGQFAFNKVGGALQGLGGTAATVGGAALGGAGGFLANPFFKELGGNAENFFRRSLGMGESANPWVGRIAASTAGSMINLPATVGAGINEWTNNLSEIVGSVKGGQTPWITGMNQGLVGETMKNIWNTYGNITNVAKGGKYEMGHSEFFDMIAKAGEGFKPVWDTFITNLTSEFTGITDFFSKLPTTLATSLTGLGDDIKSAIIGGVTNTGSGIINAGAGVIEKGKGLVTDIATKIPKFADGGTVGQSGIAWVDRGESIGQLYTAPVSGGSDIQVQILSALNTLISLMKQPTINQNTFEIKNDDDYALMQKIQMALTQVMHQSGAQRTG